MTLTAAQQLALAIGAATVLLVALTLAIDPGERRQLAAWIRWRARRPSLDRVHDLDDFRRRLAIWKEAKPR